jgi:penicillin-insensitive murein endopeptidase
MVLALAILGWAARAVADEPPPAPFVEIDVSGLNLPPEEWAPIEEAVDLAEPSRLATPPDAMASPSRPASAEELLASVQNRVSELGPLSIGTPDAGLLVNPVPMPEGPLWTIRNPVEAYGTAETIAFLRVAIETVEARHPGSPRVAIGDISRQDGGRLNRHRSHQVGRDADIGFYYLTGEQSDFRSAKGRDLDLPRTWELIRALLTETDVERVFIDRSLLRLLYAHALAAGEDRDWLDDVFGRKGEGRKGILQHERRHKDHLHVRFYNREAQERGRIVYAALVARGELPPPVIKHRVRRGETLGHLARRYGTSVMAIRRANGLRGSRLRAGRGYLIPIRRVPDLGAILVPERRLPPSRAASSRPTETGSAGVEPGSAVLER